jgi:hypothetical protein
METIVLEIYKQKVSLYSRNDGIFNLPKGNEVSLEA